MNLVSGIAMGTLLVAPFAAILCDRLAAAINATGCGLLVVVGGAAALGQANPVLDFGGWFGFGQPRFASMALPESSSHSPASPAQPSPSRPSSGRPVAGSPRSAACWPSP